jgi:phosphohistidine swiveling domain-containing protein
MSWVAAREATMTVASEPGGSHIVALDSGPATIAKVGGKGVSLARMARAGFPVPPGFLVTTDAYRAFVEANALQEAIVALANDAARPREDTSKEIRELFERASIPPDAVDEIQRAYGNLTSATGGTPPLAVRSSATAEDLPGASFAGQHDSFLNVRGEKALLDAVKRCWSSLWTARAMDYRARQGIEPSAVWMSVIVQQMVDAEASGVLFTANPLTGARDEVVLDASWGLGEAIVGGSVTPDHIVVDKTTDAIRTIVIGDKAVMTTLSDTGTVEREVEKNKRRAQVLSAAQVTELVVLGRAIEWLYGAPQDIEWCLANTKVYIVQARPITALPPAPVPWPSPIPGAKWMKDVQTAEWAKEPPSPLGATTTFAAMTDAREEANTSPQVPRHHAPWSTLINGWLYQRADHKVVSLIRFMLSIYVRFVFKPVNGHTRVERRWPDGLAELTALERIDVKGLSDAELRTFSERVLAALSWWWMEVVWFAAMGRLSTQFIDSLKVEGFPPTGPLFRGNDSLMLDSERALRKAAHDPAAVSDYLARFGHTVDSADPIDPTLRESPEHLNVQLAAASRTEVGPDERLVQTRKERQAEEQIVRTLKGLRARLARRMLFTGQTHAAHTDNAVFHFQRVLAAVRATFLEAGRRLVRAGHLEHADDVFYLERDEVWAGAESFKTTVILRRVFRDQHKRLAPPPFVPPASDPLWVKDPLIKKMSPAQREAMFGRGVGDRDGKRVLVGSPSSPGRAQGIARVISGPEDFARFNPGDVLVAQATSPIWTPLLGIAAAAVTEVGGPFAHAAIVAREFGIPLVDGATDATRVIVDGSPIVVDGTAGIVEL